MKVKTTIIAILLLFHYLGSSQIFDPEFVVTSEDLEMEIYEKDSTANAIVLREVGYSFISNKTFNLITVVKKKVKILNSNGLDRGNIEIPIYGANGQSEGIGDIKGTTYNMQNGVITTSILNKDDIYLNDKGPVAFVRFPMPNVNAGSVIVYSYVISSPFTYKYKEWYFQEDIPKLYSEYNTSIPGNWEYNVKLVGPYDFYSHTSEETGICLTTNAGGAASCIDSKYVMKDIPAFIAEDFMTATSNYISRLDFELKSFKSFFGKTDNVTKDWESTDKEFKNASYFGKRLFKKGSVKNILPDSIQNLPNNINKAKSIYRFVQNKYKWNGFNLISKEKIKNISTTNSGDAFEINTLLQNLLYSEGFETFPILLSTRDNGMITKLFPVMSNFNYLIIGLYFENQEYLLDATEKHLTFGEIPFRCLNKYGRKYDEKFDSNWIDIDIKEYSIHQDNVNLTFAGNALFTGSIESKYTGYYSQKKKEAYFKNVEAFKNNLLNKLSLFETDNVEINTSAEKQEFIENITFKYNADLANGRFYINPFITLFFSSNPFKLKSRNYPVDFGHKQLLQYSFSLDYGETLSVVETPEDKTFALPNNTGSMIFSSKVNNSNVTLFLRIKINQAIYDINYYEALKAFISEIIDIQKNQFIILEKN